VAKVGLDASCVNWCGRRTLDGRSRGHSEHTAEVSRGMLHVVLLGGEQRIGYAHVVGDPGVEPADSSSPFCG
jgi:hypothetical protein